MMNRLVGIIIICPFNELKCVMGQFMPPFKIVMSHLQKEQKNRVLTRHLHILC